MQHEMNMSLTDAIRELKALKLSIKDKLAYMQSEASKTSFDPEERASMAVRLMREKTALKMTIHLLEEGMQLHLRRAA